MAESERKQSFWTTLPGFLTAVAALLTAVTGLLVAVYPHGTPGSKEGGAGAVSQGTETARAAPAAVGGGPSGSTPPAAEQRQKAAVAVVGKDGTESRVMRSSFRDSYSGESIQLKNGQSIAFDKISSIDFLETHANEQEVRVTLTDGRVLEGAIMAGEQITGDTDIGAFSISVKDVKRILFGR